MFCKCLCWFEAVRGPLIGPKSGNRSVKIFREFLEPIWTVCDCVGAVWGVCLIIYEINCDLLNYMEYNCVYRPLEIKL